MHHDELSCLHNVWLKNGYQLGYDGEVHYEDPEGLARAITLELCLAPHRLAPEGTRYLARVLGLGASELDSALELPAGTVAACEAGSEALPPGASRMLRLLVVEALNPGALAPEVPEQPLQPAQKLVFAHTDGRWQCCERVTAAALLTDLPPAQRDRGERRAWS